MGGSNKLGALIERANNWALRRVNRGRPPKELRANLRFSEKRPSLKLMGLAKACQLLLENDELVEARQVAEEISIARRSQFTRHSAAVAALRAAAATYERCGELEAAIPLREELLVLERAKHGPGDPRTLSAMEFLAADLRNVGDASRAIELLKDAIGRWRVLHGRSTDVARAEVALGITLFSASDYAEARAVFEHVVESDPDRRSARGWLASTLAKTGDLDDALKLREETLSATERMYGSEDRRTLHDMEQVAVTLWSLQQRERARMVLERALSARERLFGDEDRETQDCRKRLQSLLDELS